MDGDKAMVQPDCNLVGGKGAMVYPIAHVAQQPAKLNAYLDGIDADVFAGPAE